MKNTKNTKVMRRLTAMTATVLMAFTAIAGSATLASAATPKAVAGAGYAAQQTKTVKFAGYGKTTYGYNWTYRTNNDVAKVNVKYSSTKHKYLFTLTGKKSGVANYNLVYYTSDNAAKSINVKVKVDSKLNVTQVGSATVTDTTIRANQKNQINNKQVVNPYNKVVNKPSNKPVINPKAQKVKVAAYGKTTKGYNWTYRTNNDIVKVTVKYNFTTHKYVFVLQGKAVGTANVTLVYYTSDTTYKTILMTVKVDAKGNVTRIA